MQLGSTKVIGGNEGEFGPQPRLVRAAREFEGQMMKELLKPLTESDGLTGDDSEGGPSSGGGVLGEFAGESLGQALSQRGGFGIADRLVAQLSHSRTAGVMAEK